MASSDSGFMGSGGIIVWIAPSLALVTANLMYLAPYGAVVAARKSGSLGDVQVPSPTAYSHESRQDPAKYIRPLMPILTGCHV